MNHVSVYYKTTCMSASSVPLAASVRHAAKHALAGLYRVWGGLLAGVRPDSPSRSDTVLLLRVAARVGVGVELGRT